MGDSWSGAARADLNRLQGPAGAWGDRPGGSPRAEPTALAGLALLAIEDDVGAGASARRAAGWLATLQRPDGSVPIAERLPGPFWPTPLALLLWSALEGFEGPRDRAADWLLRARGATLPRSPAVLGHDTTIVGWPWVAGTHSWVEPTATAILALQRVGLGDGPRVREGRRLLIDRAISTGGWNYGNRLAFGHALRPQPAPTGLALLALARFGAAAAVARPALSYLDATLPALRAAPSMAWGLLGLAAWGRTLAGADSFLAEAAGRVRRRPATASALALLLLARGARTSELLGVTQAAQSNPRIDRVSE